MSTIQRAYKTELDPNATQTRLFFQYSGAVRFAYNWMLARREAHYKETGETISGYALVKEFRAAKDTEFPWFRKYAARVEETAYRALDAAYDRFFRMCRGDLPKPKLRKPRKDGKPAGFPRFKSRKQGPTPFKFWGLKPEHIEPQRIRFQRIGWVRIKEKNYLPVGAKTLSATVSYRAGRWYVSVQAEVAAPKPTTKKGGVLGVDVGIRFLATASDGRQWKNPKALRKAQRKLRTISKKLSRQQKGSNGWQVTRLRLAKTHARIANIRTHALHQVSNELIASCPSAVCIETLNVKGMASNRHLAMSVHDAGMGELHRQIRYKAAWHGVAVVEADQWYPSSKRCSECGTINRELVLGDTQFACLECGVVLDRDLNAANNLRSYSKQELASKTGESINAGGEGSSGQADVRLDETTSVKPEAAACCSPLPETVEAVLANLGFTHMGGDGWLPVLIRNGTVKQRHLRGRGAG